MTPSSLKLEIVGHAGAEKDHEAPRADAVKGALLKERRPSPGWPDCPIRAGMRIAGVWKGWL